MKTIKILRGLGLALLFLLLLHLAVRTLGFAMYSVLERHKAEDKVWTGDFASACFAMTPRNSVDMVLIGSSHQYCSVDVTMLNREYGFNSILLASSGQDLELNYYAAMAAIELQHPKTIVLEMLAAGRPDKPGEIRRSELLDNLPNWSRAKLMAVRALGDAPYLRYYPLTAMHNRWPDLRRKDFHLPVNPLRGERLRFLYTKVTPLEPWELIPREQTAPMEEEAAAWLEKIVSLCEENDIELILYTAPYQAPESAQAIFNGLDGYAKEHGLRYRNMMYDMDAIGLDPESDFIDEGHVNCCGQEKLTRFLAETLLAE